MRSRGRRRSRSPDAAVSLFSFQDIMTAVMGILILITLLMVLDLAVTVSQPVHASVDSKMASASDLATLLSRQKELQQLYAQAVARTTQLAQLQGNDKALVQEDRRRLATTYQQISELQHKVEQARAVLAADADATKIQAQLDQLSLTEAEATRLKALIEQRQRHPRLSYIRQPGATKVPILIDLYGRAIGIGMIDEPEAAIWLTAADSAGRQRQLRDIAQGRDSHREYFVLLLRPSAFDQHDKIDRMLRDAGFNVGLELLDESTAVLPRPEE